MVRRPRFLYHRNGLRDRIALPVRASRTTTSNPSYARCFVHFDTNREILITSLRFTPPIGRMDLWNPAAWRGYLDDRRLRSRQLQSVLEANSPGRAELEIMGGDFNAPASDGIYRMLRGYVDSHRAAGRRWGHTALNTLPLSDPIRFGPEALHQRRPSLSKQNIPTTGWW